MIVEDNEFSRDALARRLTRRGFDVTVACDGLQALTVAHETRPDLILMDLGLPGIDGWEATRRLTDRELALAVGGDDFDAKPVRFERLLEKIQALL